MRIERRYVTTAILVIGAIAIALFAYAAWNRRISTSPQALLRRLPTQDAAVVGIDFSALRKAGYLKWFQAPGAQEPDYAAFVRDTGFDYQRDLDATLVSFAPDGTFFLIKATFDWPRLETYVAKNRGSCFRQFCRMHGSTPQRNISFFPLRRDLMAMAVSTDDSAASRLEKPGPQADLDIPRDPVWVSMTAGAIRNTTALPASSRLFASAILDARRLTLTIGPDGPDLAAHLDAVCRDPQQAGALQQQLINLTNLLKTGHSRALAKDDSGLVALLASGAFDQAGAHVFGRWLIQKKLAESILGNP